MYSAQVDGHASEEEQIAIQRHLRECPDCRRQAAGIRRLRADLGGLARPQPMPGLNAQLRLAMRQEAALIERTAEKRADRLEVWRMRLFSQTIGAAVSFCLFFVVITGVFKPAYRALALANAAQEVIFEETNQDAIKLKAEGFATPLLALRVEIEVVRNEELLEDRLMELVRDIPRSAAAPLRR